MGGDQAGHVCIVQLARQREEEERGVSVALQLQHPCHSSHSAPDDGTEV